MKATTEFADGREQHATWRSGQRKPTVIGVDCDGVLASDQLLWQRLRERFPQHIPATYDELTAFDWPRATPETTALCLELSADPEFTLLLDPMPYMIQALRQLRIAGYHIHMITARPARVRRATRYWLNMHGIADCISQIHCVESGLAKVPLALELGCLAFVEDNHITAEAMGAAGIRSYLFDAPYNRLPDIASIRIPGWRALLADLSRHIPTQHATAPPAAPIPPPAPARRDVIVRLPPLPPSTMAS